MAELPKHILQYRQAYKILFPIIYFFYFNKILQHQQTLTLNIIYSYYYSPFPMYSFFVEGKPQHHLLGSAKYLKFGKI